MNVDLVVAADTVVVDCTDTDVDYLVLRQWNLAFS